jgi:hypothetical protein
MIIVIIVIMNSEFAGEYRVTNRRVKVSRRMADESEKSTVTQSTASQAGEEGVEHLSQS